MLGNFGKDPSLCAMNDPWIFQTVIFCFSLPGHLKLRTERLISSFSPSVPEPPSSQVCEWGQLSEKWHVWGGYSRCKRNKRSVITETPPEGSNESENGGEGGQEGTVTHRSKMSPQQWPKQGAGVWLKVAKEPPSPVSFPGGSDSKEPTCREGDLGVIPSLGRSPGGGNGNPLQDSSWRIPMDRGVWRATVHEVTESQTTERLKAQGPTRSGVRITKVRTPVHVYAWWFRMRRGKSEL